MLSPRLLNNLRAYWRLTRRHADYLPAGTVSGRLMRPFCMLRAARPTAQRI